MTAPRLSRLTATLLLAGLGAACGKDKPPAGVLCQLPPPQPSALPTLPVVAGPGQAQAIHFGTKTTGQTVTFEVPPDTASVTIVEQAASQVVPLTVRGGFSSAPNTPVPLSVAVGGQTIFYDVPMPPDTAFPVVDGITVLDPLAAPGLAVYFLSPGAWTGALTLPNTSVAIPGTAAPAGVPAGTWTVEVNDWAAECRAFPFLGCSATTLTPSVYDVTVILKPAVPAPANAMKVVFYLVTNTGLTAANASANLDLRRMEWAVATLLGPTGVLGAAGITPAFEYRDVPADVRLHYATGVDANSAGVCGGLGQLLQLAAPGNQLNVFLVDLVRDSGGGPGTVGIDPAVPGPASFGGTPASGVLVSIDYLGLVRAGGCVPGQLSIGDCGNDITAAIVAHEAGHFLGLYHTTEGIGTIVDPIGDTATCFCQRCGAAPSQCQGLGQTDPQVASPYRMMVTDCLGSVPECGGGDNLMFWLLDVDSKGLLTAGQAAVMRASPLVE